MKALLLLSTATVLGFFATAQNDDKEKQHIEAQLDAFINSWNRHDFSDMANYTTTDIDWVNVVGMWWKGRRQVQFAHDAFHKTMFRTVPIRKVSTDIRLVTPDVAIVHSITRAGSYSTPSGIKVPEGNNIATMIFVRKEGRWLITACENIGINEQAQASDPVKHMPGGY